MESQSLCGTNTRRGNDRCSFRTARVVRKLITVRLPKPEKSKCLFARGAVGKVCYTADAACVRIVTPTLITAEQYNAHLDPDPVPS